MNTHKSLENVDLGFSINNELKVLKQSGKVKEIEIQNFKKGAVKFLVTLCQHALEKSQLKSLLTGCFKSLNPIFMVECPSCETLFE